MSKYRKKPVIIEARCFGDNAGDQSDMARWVNENGGSLKLFDGAAEQGKFSNGYGWRWTHGSIETLEGIMRVNIGDYVIQGVQGEFYPCKPDIFEATYEPVDNLPMSDEDNKETIQ